MASTTTTGRPCFSTVTGAAWARSINRSKPYSRSWPICSAWCALPESARLLAILSILAKKVGQFGKKGWPVGELRPRHAPRPEMAFASLTGAVYGEKSAERLAQCNGYRGRTGRPGGRLEPLGGRSGAGDEDEWDLRKRGLGATCGDRQSEVRSHAPDRRRLAEIDRGFEFDLMAANGRPRRTFQVAAVNLEI